MFKYWTQVKLDDINHMNVWTTYLPKISDQRKELSVVSLVLTRRRKAKVQSTGQRKKSDLLLPLVFMLVSR